MSHAQRMIEMNPNPAPMETATLVECIEACLFCAQACSTDCADACLGEQDILLLMRSIRLNLDCADLCAAAGSILSRQTTSESEMARIALEACSQARRRCGEECDQHADHMEHCRVCAEVCRRCESACNNLLSALGRRYS
jgi:hypothetical protein